MNYRTSLSFTLSRRRFLWLSSLGVTGAALWPNAALAADRWLQNFKETDLWSSAKPDAKKVTRAPQWSYFKQLGDQDGPRFPVEHPTTRKKVYVDAIVVGPSGPPPAGWAFGSPAPATAMTPAPASPAAPAPPDAAGKPAAPTQIGDGTWLTFSDAAMLWTTLSGGLPLGTVDGTSFFQALSAPKGGRLQVKDTLTGAVAFVDAKSAVAVAQQPAQQWVPARWWGLVGVDNINVRSAPSGDGELLGTLAKGTPVSVSAWVSGQEVFPDQPGWAMLADDVYVYGPLLRKAWIDAPPPAGPAPAEKWLDVNLTQQTVTAYEGGVPVYMTVTSSGRPGWETHEGMHTILWRKENETMDSHSLIGQDAARADYKVENVRWTQYFTNDGQALHENYWRDPALFGIPSSHGCLGMVAQDALWFWLWAERGTSINVHY
jgi:hypothetical protein